MTGRMRTVVLVILALLAAQGTALGWAGGGYGGGGGGGGGFGGGGGWSGGRSGGSHHGSSSGVSGGRAADASPVGMILLMCFFVGIIGVLAYLMIKKGKPGITVYRPDDLAPKPAKTLRLLNFIAKTDPAFEPEALRDLARSTFLALQKQWQARDYEPVRHLLMPDLYAQHCGRIESMIRDHEINVIQHAEVRNVSIVNVRYTHERGHREFTVLITATGADYYIDDRTRAWRRGSRTPTQFQEFWTFQLQGQKFLLREIEQAAESSVMSQDNFFEPFTDAATGQIYGAVALRTDLAGPALEMDMQAKGSRIERLLNFLVQTDKLWDRQLMLERVRETFLKVHLARETGGPAAVPADLLFPDVAADLAREINARRETGSAIEFRNLCVRKIDLVLVRNFPANEGDEFLARITAHAQKTVKAGGTVVQQDADVTTFAEYWTFGRLDGQWKLKEVLPPARGRAAVEQENLDLDSTPEQVQWYYSKKRAV